MGVEFRDVTADGRQVFVEICQLRLYGRSSSICVQMALSDNYFEEQGSRVFAADCVILFPDNNLVPGAFRDRLHQAVE